MTTPAELIPPNEGARLAALRAYRLLGNTPDGVFAEMVRLTATLFQVPIALISLVDQHRVEFTANFGLAGVKQVPRNQSLCSVAVLRNETTVFENLHASPCRLTDPQAAQQHGFGFYAGHPLTTPWGQNIGVLCVLDSQPRQLSAPERQRLALLAHLVRQLFDLRALLAGRPGSEVAHWQQIQRCLEQSFTRLATLPAPGQQPDATEAGQRYQEEVAQETARLMHALEAQLADARQQLA